jgi:predicted DNA-binding antitoxin AbrB/MazE fold protein
MMNTIWGVVREGKIVPLESVEIPEGAKVLVTLLSEEDDFWSAASQPTLSAVWDNTEDDVYAELLEK